MRKVLALILFLILVSTSYAQEPHKVFLPIIMKFVKSDLKNSWQIVKPVASTNYVLNPSAELTGNFAAIGSATITRVTTYAKYGLNSYRVQTFATNTGLSLTLGTLTNSDHWMTLRIRGTLPKELRLSIGPDSKKVVFLERIDDYWSLYGAMFGASESNGATSARISQFGTGSGDFFVDGIQIEPLGDWTTYIDGTQDGCEWNGADHASTSSRSGEYIGGGTPQDLYQEYKFFVTKIVGAGASTPNLSIDSYALLPGGELNSIKTEPRQFTLIGKFIADTEMELHDARQNLIEVLKLATPGQPLKLRFSGGRVQKEIGVFYQGGLEGDLAEFYKGLEPIEDNQWGEVSQYIEKASIQLSAPDPYWYEVGESAASLDNTSSTIYSEPDTVDSATFRLVAGRLRSTGQWSPLGPPGAGSTQSAVRGLAEDATYLYMVGEFLNLDGNGSADGIIRYNKQTGIYSAMGTGAVSFATDVVVAPDGLVYVAGDFASVGGVANTKSIARWNPVSETWSALATGFNNNEAAALAIGLDGTLYIGGTFVSGGIPNADRVVAWNGTSFSPLGAGVDGTVFALAINPVDGALFVGGSFATAGGVSSPLIARWNPATGTWSALGSGLTGTSVQGAVVRNDGVLFVTGLFTASGTTALSNIASWNGVSFSPLGAGLDDDGFVVNIGQDNMLYAGGLFSSAGGINVADRIARWNGYTWAHLDIDLPGSGRINAILPSKYVDPVIKQKYNLFLGFTTIGTGYFAGKFTVTNEGNVPAFPKIVYYRNSGTFAIIETLKNERTGKELLFDYRLLSGETLQIDLTPTNKTITSSFFGSRLDAVLANSDFGTFALLPESNDITTFVAVSGGPVLTAYMLWRDVYDSWD